MWAVIFSFFAVPRRVPVPVLFWGIFGALVLRAVFIVAGTELIERFEWILYIFGAFLLYTAWKIAHHDETEVVDYNQNIAMRAVRRLVPTTDRVRRPEAVHQAERQAGRHAAVRRAGAHRGHRRGVRRRLGAGHPRREPGELHRVLRRTPSPSSACGRCSSCSAGMAGKFRYLNVGLGVILAYVGVKMLLVGKPVKWHPPTVPARCVVIGVVLDGRAIWASLRADKPARARPTARSTTWSTKPPAPDHH